MYGQLRTCSTSKELEHALDNSRRTTRRDNCTSRCEKFAKTTSRIVSPRRPRHELRRRARPGVPRDRRPARHEHGQRAGEALREANCDAALREANCDASRVAWTTVAPPRETTRRDVSSTTAAAHTNYDDARDLAFPEIGDLRVTSTDNAQVKHFAKRIVESSIARAVSSHHGLR